MWALVGLAAEDGLLDPDAPIHRSWTGRGLLSHEHKALDIGHHRTPDVASPDRRAVRQRPLRRLPDGARHPLAQPRDVAGQRDRRRDQARRRGVGDVDRRPVLRPLRARRARQPGALQQRRLLAARPGPDRGVAARSQGRVPGADLRRAGRAGRSLGLVHGWLGEGPARVLSDHPGLVHVPRPAVRHRRGARPERAGLGGDLRLRPGPVRPPGRHPRRLAGTPDRRRRVDPRPRWWQSLRCQRREPALHGDGRRHHRRPRRTPTGTTTESFLPEDVFVGPVRR